MRALCTITVLALLVHGVAAPSASAAPPANKQVEQQQPGETLESNLEQSVSATTIDFAATLGLGFDSLRSLGVRIEQARSAADPVGVAMAATELSVAEKVAGKQAAIHANGLLEEAVKMAEARRHPEELKALALIVSDPQTRETLTEQAKQAEQARADRQGGAQPRGIQQDLIVTNLTEKYAKVYVNYGYRGTVGPYEKSTFWVGASEGAWTVLEAYTTDGTGDWGPVNITTEEGTVWWTLTY